MLAEIIWNERTVAIVMTFSISLSVILGGIWFKTAQVRSENDLKRSMVERGMSVDEIERVIAAKTSRK